MAYKDEANSSTATNESSNIVTRKNESTNRKRTRKRISDVNNENMKKSKTDLLQSSNHKKKSNKKSNRKCQYNSCSNSIKLTSVENDSINKTQGKRSIKNVDKKKNSTKIYLK